MGESRDILGRVAVVGCGIAGPAVAALLSQRGWDVTVYERATPLGPVGAGVLLQPTGQAVLGALGVLDEVKRRASSVLRLWGRTTTGRAVLDLAYDDLSPGLVGLGVTRGALFGSLLSVMRSSGASLVEGCDVTALASRDGREWARDAEGNDHGPFDLVLVCDGARSAHRPAGSPARTYAWGALWAVLPDASGVFDGTLSQVYEGTRTMLGFLPSGSPAEGQPATVSLFWSLRTAEIAHVRAGDLGAFKRRLETLEPRLSRSLAHLIGWDQLIPAVYADAAAKPSVVGRRVYLGDAAHAMSPQLGQGANLALVDAWTLARELPARAHATAQLLDAATERYAERRHDHARFYRHASRLLTPWFQSDHTPLAWCRDLCLYPLSRVRWIRRQMLLSLAGGKTGVFGHLPPEQLPVPSGERKGLS